MASSGKRGRKVKGKTLGLNEFLADENDAPQMGYAATTAKTVDWAAEMENEMPDDKYTLDGAFGSGSSKSVFILPTAPRASREPLSDMSKIPSRPPFTAFIANLPYDCEQEDLTKFFMKLNVKSVRLPKEDNGRMKGYGYAEFGDRESLVEALGMTETPLKGRNLRISPADQNQENDSRDESSDRTVGDWRSAPRDDMPARDDGFRKGGSESFPERYQRERFSQDRERSFGGDRGGDRERSFGGDRGGDRERSFGGDRGGDRDRAFGGDRDRAFGGDRDRDRAFGGDRGGDRDRAFGGDRDRDRGRERFGRGFERSGRNEDYDRGNSNDRSLFSDRMENRDRTENRDHERDNDGGFSRGYERGGRSNRRDFGSDFRGDRYSGRGFDDFDGGRGGSRNNDRYDKGGSAYDRDDKKEPTKERPKLILKPRSAQATESAGSATSATSKIFGAAKPVDTAAREREIAERIEREREGKLARREPEHVEREPAKWDRKSESSESESRESVKIGQRDEDRQMPRRRSSIELQQKHVEPYEPASSRTTQVDGDRGSQSEPEDDRYERNSLPTAGKPPSPRKEDSKARPAPPPVVNIWEKRASAGSEKENHQYNTVPRTKRSSSIGSNASNASDKDSGRRSSVDRPPSGRKQESESYNSGRRREDSRGRRREDQCPLPRDDSASRRRNERAGENRGGGRSNRGSGGRNRGEKTISRRDGSESSQEQDREKPRDRSRELKYEEPKPPVYASQNKFCLLNEDEDAPQGYGSN